MHRAPALLLRCLAALLLLAPLAATAQIQGSAIFLVATAKMSDPRFAKSVVLVTRHGRSPPLGVIINKPLGLKLGDVQVPSLEPPKEGQPNHPGKVAETPLYFGGPVGTNALVYLFLSDQAPPPPDAIVVTKGVHLGRSADSLNQLLSGKRAHNGLKVFAGYSRWAFGQLEQEIAHGHWDVQQVDREYLFDKEPDLIWPELHRRATQVTTRLDRPVLPLLSPLSGGPIAFSTLE